MGLGAGAGETGDDCEFWINFVINSTRYCTIKGRKLSAVPSFLLSAFPHQSEIAHEAETDEALCLNYPLPVPVFCKNTS